MKCTNCGSKKMVEIALIANPIWKIKAANEIKKNKFERKSISEINAYLCKECGHIDLWLEGFKNE